MQFLIGVAVFIIFVAEVLVRFMAAPAQYNWCTEQFSHLDTASKEHYCSCRSDLLVSKRYEFMFAEGSQKIDNLFSKNKKEGSVISKLQGFSQCAMIERRVIQEKIENSIERDVRDKVIAWLPPTIRQNLQGIALRRYDINVHEEKNYKYVVDVYFTVSEGVFGIVQHKNFQGKFYYYWNGEFADAEWKSTGSNINADGFIEGTKKFMNLFNDNSAEV